MKPYGVFVSASANYIPYLNAFLNSISKQDAHKRNEFEVVVLSDGTIPENYMRACESSLPYDIVFDTLAGLPLDAGWPNSWKCKAGRYFYLLEHGKRYCAVCLMDADLWLTSPQLFDFLPMVEATPNLVGCNERIKWNISGIYTLDGKPILEKSQRLFKFHCNVPLFLDVNNWEEVIEDYTRIVFRGKELRETEKTIGDLYSWNLAVYRQGREDDVILTPMQGMTQVHRTGYRDKNCVIKKTPDGYWCTEDGDQVYCLHGRPDKPAFKNIERKNEFAKHGIDQGLYKRYTRLIEQEWLDVNFNCDVDLREFVPNNPHWAEMGK